MRAALQRVRDRVRAYVARRLDVHAARPADVLSARAEALEIEIAELNARCDRIEAMLREDGK